MSPIEVSTDCSGAAAVIINAARSFGRTMIFRTEMEIAGFMNNKIVQVKFRKQVVRRITKLNKSEPPIVVITGP